MNGLRILFLKSPTGWTAMDIDRGFAAQGEKVMPTMQSLFTSIADTIEYYKSQNLDWEKHVKPVPQKFIDAYENSIIDITLRDMVVIDLIGVESLSSVESRLAENEVGQELCLK